MEKRPRELSRAEKLNANIDLRIIDIAAALSDFETIPPSVFNNTTLAAYRLGEEDAGIEVGTETDLFRVNGYKASQAASQRPPLWHLVEMPLPNDDEIKDFLIEHWRQRNEDFLWPERAMPYEDTLVYIRSAYGLGYTVIVVQKAG